MGIVASSSQWEWPFARRHQLGYRDAVAGDEDLLALEDGSQEFGEIGFGVVDVVTGHGSRLVRFTGQVNPEVL